jgi:hypothetical protein
VEPVEGTGAVPLVREPGLLIGRPVAIERVEVRRLFEPRGIPVEEAEVLGWVRVE